MRNCIKLSYLCGRVGVGVGGVLCLKPELITLNSERVLASCRKYEHGILYILYQLNLRYIVVTCAVCQLWYRQ